ncbi:prolipoprotein diacylglyceryl transferase [Aestuariivita boseongensis]|uniref:prolipoprotein diacylglyceryl transferase n=1 Tax=Aestuariivita boseongensis TaxID=1470562 RepID=UPI00068216F9|nr:prolipoprotein diacylglyceryl transferase [Aestuariivita boseongensis]
MHAAIQFPDLSPELFSFAVGSFEFALRWYALAYIAGILVAWWLAIRAVENARLWPGGTGVMTRDQVGDFLTWAVVGIILGGRLGFVLFYQPAFYLQNPTQIPMIWQGGMAFHGGLLGVIVAAYLYTGYHNMNRFQAADLIALCVPPGLFFGRLANFVNAELWGRPTDLPWGVIFPGAAAQDCPDVLGLCARHPSQLYEALLEGLILGAALILLAWRKGAFHRPGLIAGVFFAGYGAARFAVEFVRQPDAQFVSAGNPLGLALQAGGYGLTMGQILSLPMIALGLWLVTRAKTRA